ncbi:MAG: TetR/AcrR family transcriptional regulator [Clostridia bacterium]|nr:TetR/AcrR family transcriptional regulator [Clostridia bacterium]
MKKRKADSRIPRTRAAIRKAYLGLLGQKEASEITVTDIAQEAALDRKTIYNYYASPAAILEELEDDLVHTVGNAVSNTAYLSGGDDPFGFLQAVTNAFNANDDLTTPLLKKNKSSRVLDKLAAMVSVRFGASLEKRIKPSKKRYAKLYAEFLTSGIVSVYRDWIEAGMQQSLEEISKQVTLLVRGGMTSFIV